MPTDMPSPTLERPLENDRALAHVMKFLVARAQAKSQQETKGNLQFVDLSLFVDCILSRRVSANAGTTTLIRRTHGRIQSFWEHSL